MKLRLFKVEVLGDSGWLYTVAIGLTRVDMVKDRRFGSVNLSKTTFEGHPILASELSSLSARNAHRREPERTYPRLQLSSYLSLADSYTNNEALGYIPDSKAADLRQAVAELQPNWGVTLQRVRPDNHIKMEKDKVVVNVELGPPSLEAKIAERRRFEEVKKEAEHPEGRLHAKYSEMLALIPPHEPTAEEIEWENTWREMVKGTVGTPSTGDTCPVDEGKNRLVSLRLESESGEDFDAIFDSMYGVPLTTPERAKEVVEFYSSAYATFVNAFCKIEGVKPPQARVLLGSARISQ